VVGILHAMADLELTRTPDDRPLYALEGVGLRLEGLTSRRATAEAGGASWRISRRSFWGRALEATDAAGTAVGEFEPRGMRRGGTVRWAGRDLALRPASRSRERYALADGDREVVVLDGRGWGRGPVKVTLDDDPTTIDAGLLLFAAFVVRGLAEDAAGAGATAGAS
jgi:hypothetical protein